MYEVLGQFQIGEALKENLTPDRGSYVRIRATPRFPDGLDSAQHGDGAQRSQATTGGVVDQQKLAVKYYWTAMLGILFSFGEFPARAKLEALHSQYKDTIDDGDLSEGQQWEQIVALALTEEEEHNPKLVYVMRLLWKRFGHRSIFRVAAGHFTTTPEVPRLGSGVILSADIPC